MGKFFKLCSCACLFISMIILGIACVESYNLPVEIKITKGSSGVDLGGSLPLTTCINNDNKQVISQKDMSLGSTYSAQVKLMNVFPVKNLDIKMVNEKTVVPCGNPFGIQIYTEGAVIVGMPGIKKNNDIVNPASDAGLKMGDIILKINGETIDNNDVITSIVERTSGDTVTVDAKRDNKIFQTNLTPHKCENGHFKIGIWVRDSSAGIGIMTFYDPDTGVYGGLGHGICDVDVCELLPLRHGDIVGARINGITKGEKGSPGELKGCFSSKVSIGSLDFNSNTGVYGILKDPKLKENEERMPVAMKQQIKTGSAKIICTISGDKKEYYDIKITEVNYKKDSPTRNMVVEITDQKLLNTTGGIVQGMSGSPIVQNGMFVGAVTHVFVNDPTRGYAIFAENMVEQADGVTDMTIEDSY